VSPSHLARMVHRFDQETLKTESRVELSLLPGLRRKYVPGSAT
jgi:hypothetical protein